MELFLPIVNLREICAQKLISGFPGQQLKHAHTSNIKCSIAQKEMYLLLKPLVAKSLVWKLILHSLSQLFWPEMTQFLPYVLVHEGLTVEISLMIENVTWYQLSVWILYHPKQPSLLAVSQLISPAGYQGFETQYLKQIVVQCSKHCQYHQIHRAIKQIIFFQSLL